MIDSQLGTCVFWMFSWYISLFIQYRYTHPHIPKWSACPPLMPSNCLILKTFIKMVHILSYQTCLVSNWIRPNVWVFVYNMYKEQWSISECDWNNDRCLTGLFWNTFSCPVVLHFPVPPCYIFLSCRVTLSCPALLHFPVPLCYIFLSCRVTLSCPALLHFPVPPCYIFLSCRVTLSCPALLYRIHYYSQPHRESYKIRWSCQVVRDLWNAVMRNK